MPALEIVVGAPVNHIDAQALLNVAFPKKIRPEQYAAAAVLCELGSAVAALVGAGKDAEATLAAWERIEAVAGLAGRALLAGRATGKKNGAAKKPARHKHRFVNDFCACGERAPLGVVSGRMSSADPPRGPTSDTPPFDDATSPLAERGRALGAKKAAKAAAKAAEAARRAMGGAAAEGGE